MIDLVVSNLRRSRARTLLTASGIAVGVATIVALLALTAGIEQRAGGLVHLGRADLGVFQRDAADPTTSVLPLDLGRRLEARPDVVHATPLQLLVEANPVDPSAIVFGVDPNGFVAQRAVLAAGRRPRGREIMLGDTMAGQLHARVGDLVEIQHRRLRVSGIYHSGIAFEDNGAMLPLPIAQQLAGRRPDETTTFAVTLAPDVSAAQAAKALTRQVPGITVISDPEEAARAGANSFLISKSIPLIVALALIVGGLGVANTMVMAVLERQREMALLATIGWSPRQLGGLVMAEAVGVSVLGAGLGLLLGFAAAEILTSTLALRELVSPQFTAWGLGRGLLVGFAIGILGGLYPTWRVARLSPAPILARG